MENLNSNHYQRWVKRTLDFIFSSLVLVALIPLLLIVAFLVKCCVGSPIVFKQKRPGMNEKIFTLYKFRSMTNDIDSQGNLLPDSSRITKFGRILRSTSLDELPQLFNVLKGDMSIVGPRPLFVRHLPLYNEHQRKRHDVRPGLTGLAQVNGRKNLSWAEKIDYDLEYISNVNFILDTKIIFKTVGTILSKEGVESASLKNRE